MRYVIWYRCGLKMPHFATITHRGFAQDRESAVAFLEELDPILFVRAEPASLVLAAEDRATRRNEQEKKS